jgi:hypothetical protein
MLDAAVLAPKLPVPRKGLYYMLQSGRASLSPSSHHHSLSACSLHPTLFGSHRHTTTNRSRPGQVLPVFARLSRNIAASLAKMKGASITLNLCLLFECVYMMPLLDTRERASQPSNAMTDARARVHQKCARTHAANTAQASKQAVAQRSWLHAIPSQHQWTAPATGHSCWQHGTLVPHDTAGQPHTADRQRPCTRPEPDQKYRGKRPCCCWQLGAGWTTRSMQGASVRVLRH